MNEPRQGPPEEGTPGDQGRDAPLTEADVERMLRALDAPDPASGAEPPARLAVIVTPVASASALAGLCALSGIDVDVVPSSTGALATLETVAAEKDGDWDTAELFGGEDGGFPPPAEELARTLAKLIRADVLLLVSDLANDVGIETGLSGQLSARRYAAGGESAGEDVPAGLVIAGADQVLEELILGRTRPEEVSGHLRSGSLPRGKAARLFGRALRKKKG